MYNHFKRMTKSGSVNIPVGMRRELGIQEKDPVEVSTEEGKIIIEPYSPRCTFCGGRDGVIKFHGRGICKNCAKQAVNKFEGRD